MRSRQHIPLVGESGDGLVGQDDQAAPEYRLGKEGRMAKRFTDEQLTNLIRRRNPPKEAGDERQITRADLQALLEGGVGPVPEDDASYHLNTLDDLGYAPDPAEAFKNLMGDLPTGFSCANDGDYQRMYAWEYLRPWKLRPEAEGDERLREILLEMRPYNHDVPLQLGGILEARLLRVWPQRPIRELHYQVRAMGFEFADVITWLLFLRDYPGVVKYYRNGIVCAGSALRHAQNKCYYLPRTRKLLGDPPGSGRTHVQLLMRKVSFRDTNFSTRSHERLLIVRDWNREDDE